MALPIQYHIEVYEVSFLNDPVWGTQASSPFPSMAVGDSFNHRTLGEFSWDKLPQQGQEFVVSKIEHIFWEMSGSHIGHKLMVALEIRDLPDFHPDLEPT